MDDDQGYIPLAPPGQRKPPVNPIPAPNSAPSGDGYVPLAPPGQRNQPAQTTQQTSPPPPAQPSQGWGIDWSNPWSKGGPALTMPQSAQDWSTIAAQNSSMGLAGLKTQADAARARIGPVAAANADLVGGTISPSIVLNLLGGPELAGAVHQGVQSYMEQPNWWPDLQGWKTIGEDTAVGGATGGLARGASALSPGALSKLTRLGVNTGLTTAAHKLLGGYFGGDLLKEGASLLGGLPSIDEVGKWSGEQMKSLAGTPAARQAIQNLILGGGAAFRQGAGPWDQWVPGQ
jgi:hypothetical protein